jgi:hypothetical protein
MGVGRTSLCRDGAARSRLFLQRRPGPVPAPAGVPGRPDVWSPLLLGPPSWKGYPPLRLRRITTIPHVAAPSGNDHQALTARSAPTPDVGVLARTSRRSVRTRSKKPAVRPRERERERVRRQRRVAAGRASGSRALGSPPPPRLRRVCSSSVMAQRLPAPCLVAICGSATASSEMMPAVSPRGWATQPRARASLCREAAAAAARSRRACGAVLR